MQYVLLFRGINVGGNTTVSMASLKKNLEDLGCQRVITLLNSGNVICESSEERTRLREIVEKKLEAAYGFPLTVIIRTGGEIQKLIALNPFKKLSLTPSMRINVTFLTEKSMKKIAAEDFTVIAQYEDTVCTMIDLDLGKGSSDIMTMLEKTYGKEITTRTWKTIQKIANKLP